VVIQPARSNRYLLRASHLLGAVLAAAIGNRSCPNGTVTVHRLTRQASIGLAVVTLAACGGEVPEDA